MPDDGREPAALEGPVRGARRAVMNALLLAWPFVPPVLFALLLGPYLITDSAIAPPPWRLLVLRLPVPWCLAGMLLGAGVLLRLPSDRLTRRGITMPAASIALDAAWIWLCWVAAYRWSWPVGF
jgi:hypothetical protein